MEGSPSTTIFDPMKTVSSGSFSSVEAYPVNVHELTKQELARLVWLLRPAVEDHPDGLMSDVVREAFDDEACFWAVATEDAVIGAMVTRVIQFDTGYTVLCVVAAATDKSIRLTKKQMRKIAEDMEDMAMRMGLDGMRICGRPGWGRVLDGYKEVDRTYDKVFDRKES